MNDNIKLDTIELVIFDRQNSEHIEFLKKIVQDKEITKYFQGFLNNLLRKSNDIFDRGYFVRVNDQLVGYFDLGKYNEAEKAVYVREAVVKEYRGKHLGFGKLMLKEVSDYLFNTYDDLNCVKGVINKENKFSQNTMFSVGGYSVGNDYYLIENPNKKVK